MMRKENNAQIIPVLVNKFRDLNTVKLIEAVIAKLKLRKDNGAGVLAAIDYENIPELERWIKIRAGAYLEVMADFRSVCENRNRHFIGILQPTLFLSKKITDEETVDARLDEDRGKCIRDIIRSFYGIVRPVISKQPYLYDFTSLFNNIDETLYVDVAHYNVQATEIISRNIADLLETTPVFLQKTKFSLNTNNKLSPQFR